KSADKKKDFDLLHQGVDMISKQLHKLLEEKGLKRIDCVGEKFNPHEHDAIEVVEEDIDDEDKITEEFQPGYKLNDRVIRPSKVKVTKKKEPKEEEKVEDQEQENQEDNQENDEN
ncbi:nucleotide exchange factor GrpE, partial [Candidatus Omnitrophota bacterium]